MSVLRIIHDERRGSREQMRPIVHIRISTDGMPGAPVAVPVTPERARTLGKLVALSEDVVEVAYDGRALEILLHPEDWYDLLKDTQAIPAVQLPLSEGEPYRVMGIPVSHD